MKQVYRFGNQGTFIEPVIIRDGEAIPVDCTDKELPQPNWKPVFDKVKKIWVETITETEKQQLTNVEQPKTEVEILREETAQLNLAIIDLYEILMG